MYAFGRNANRIQKSKIAIKARKPRKTLRKYRYPWHSVYVPSLSVSPVLFSLRQYFRSHSVPRARTSNRKGDDGFPKIGSVFFFPSPSQEPKCQRRRKRYAYLAAGKAVKASKGPIKAEHTVDSETKQFLFQPRCALLLSPSWAATQRPPLTPPFVGNRRAR